MNDANTRNNLSNFAKSRNVPLKRLKEILDVHQFKKLNDEECAILDKRFPIKAVEVIQVVEIERPLIKEEKLYPDKPDWCTLTQWLMFGERVHKMGLNPTQE